MENDPLWTHLRYMRSDRGGDCPLSKPVRITATAERLLDIFSVKTAFPGKGDEDPRAEMMRWMSERNMIAELTEHWSEKPVYENWMRPDGRPTRREKLLGWKLAFDSEDDAIEFKIRWL